jgi:hypothetical protein
LAALDVEAAVMVTTPVSASAAVPALVTAPPASATH